MAKLNALPELSIIHAFRGIVDFYLWRGIPCARSWPYNPASHHSPGTKAASALFGLVIKSWATVASEARSLYAASANDQPKTPRDLFVSAKYGTLHEAAMTDFLTLLTECRDFLSELTALLDALHSVDTDELQVNVETSALPAGAATLAEQQTQTTALQTIDNLVNALASADTDQLHVTGSDQLYSYKGQYKEYHKSLAHAAGDIIFYTDQVPAGEVWFLTSVSIICTQAACSLFRWALRYAGPTDMYQDSLLAPAADQMLHSDCFIPMVEGDRLRIDLQGVGENKNVHASVLGIKMTVP